MKRPLITKSFKTATWFCISLICMLLSYGHAASAQKLSEKNGISFKIKALGNSYNEETIVKTFESADLRFLRFQSTDNVLVLDDSSEIEIFSAEKLIPKGYNIDVSQYQKSYPPKHVMPVFSIHKNILLQQQSVRPSNK